MMTLEQHRAAVAELVKAAREYREASKRVKTQADLRAKRAALFAALDRVGGAK